jgi:hypothetical protein
MGFMKILIWALRIIGIILIIPIVLLFPGFFILQAAEEIEDAHCRKEGKWR